MDQPNRIELRLTWEGREYSCRPDMRALVMIEERVLLHQLARKVLSGADQIPMTHLVWVVYCLLYTAGARCTADDVYEAVSTERLSAETMMLVAQWIVEEVYGPGPRKREEDEEPEPGKPEA